MTETNVLTLSFGTTRPAQVRKEQITLLANRVIDECYGGRYADMLVDLEADQQAGYKGSLLHWLQEKLGTVSVTKSVGFH